MFRIPRHVFLCVQLGLEYLAHTENKVIGFFVVNGDQVPLQLLALRFGLHPGEEQGLSRPRRIEWHLQGFTLTKGNNDVRRNTGTSVGWD